MLTRSSTSISSGIKTSYLSQLANRTDFTWATFDIFAWVTVEFFLLIICGTIPTLKPIFEKLAERWKSEISSRRYGSYGNSRISRKNASNMEPSSQSELATTEDFRGSKWESLPGHHPLELQDYEHGTIKVQTSINVE
jgi:hypothetical protein